MPVTLDLSKVGLKKHCKSEKSLFYRVRPYLKKTKTNHCKIYNLVLYIKDGSDLFSIGKHNTLEKHSQISGCL